MSNNKGEGAIWAAPIFRRVMEIYFYGSPQTVYPWENSFGVLNPDYGHARDPHSQAVISNIRMSAEQIPGLIVRSQSGFFTVQTNAGILTCHLRGRLKQGKHVGDIAAVGDRVLVPDSPKEWGASRPSYRATARWSGWIRDRRGCTSRSSWPTRTRRSSSSPAPVPTPHLRMLDRYLVIAERQSLPAIIVANKIDLVGRAQAEEIVRFLPHDRVPGASIPAPKPARVWMNCASA